VTAFQFSTGARFTETTRHFEEARSTLRIEDTDESSHDQVDRSRSEDLLSKSEWRRLRVAQCLIELLLQSIVFLLNQAYPTAAFGSTFRERVTIDLPQGCSGRNGRGATLCRHVKPERRHCAAASAQRTALEELLF